MTTIEQLLANNRAWRTRMEAERPDFFRALANQQHPIPQSDASQPDHRPRSRRGVRAPQRRQPGRAQRPQLPVGDRLAADLGGLAEVVRDGENGLLFRAGDERSLRAAIGRLCHEPGLYQRLRPAAPRTVAEDLAAFAALYRP